MQIHVGIVESHDVALPFYYSLIRKKLIPSSNMTLIHFDAHPDLSIPSHNISKTTANKNDNKLTSSTSSVTQWKDLFILESLLAGTEGGIAEWILPLIYNQIFKKVVWIRNHFCSQFSDGIYEFCIGDKAYGPDASPKACISLAEPYFNVENVVAAVKDMKPDTVRNGSLEVILVDDFGNLPTEQGQYYILDICLDYFSTENPFLKELKQLIALDLLSVDGDSDDQILDSVVAVMEHVQKHYKTAADKEAYEMKIRILSDIVHGGSLPTRSVFSDEYDKLISIFHHNIQSLSRATKEYIWNNRTVLNLPHCIATEAQLDCSIRQFKEHLSLFILRNGLPLAVSIARSVEDGYTPQSNASNLQCRVLDTLQDIVTSSHSLVVHELIGTDAWHDSFSLFLNNNCKRYIKTESDGDEDINPSEASKIQKCNE